jgi:radical SAM protein with 4Fe4S-binding SPASM domain
MFHWHNPDPLLHPVFKAVVDKLNAAGCQLLVVCRGSLDELSALADVPGNASILLEVEGFVGTGGINFKDLEKVCRTLQNKGVNFGLRLANPRFKLPNIRINDNDSTVICRELVRPADVEYFRLLAVDFPDFKGRLQLDVHDLFLWEILFPDGGVARSEYGGCQAANSLAHIDSFGTVHPCLSWPQPLGSLLNDSFYDIWQALPRQDVRTGIAAVPGGCHDCRDYAICFGGCRGLSRLDLSLNGRDPMCEGSCS